MTITVDIRPEVQAELARQADAQGQPIEVVAAALLEGAVNPISAQQPAAATAEPTQPERRTGQRSSTLSRKSVVCLPTKRLIGCSPGIPRGPGPWTCRERRFSSGHQYSFRVDASPPGTKSEGLGSCAGYQRVVSKRREHRRTGNGIYNHARRRAADTTRGVARTPSSASVSAACFACNTGDCGAMG